MRDYFEEMNIDYEELNDYKQIDTYYDEIKDYSKLIDNLQTDRVECQKYIVRVNQKNKELQTKIDKAIEDIKEDIDYWQDAIYVELKAEDFIKILNNYLEILGDKENE